MENLEGKLETVKVCIKNGGGLHGKIDELGRKYCRISKYTPSKTCEYQGEPIMVKEQVSETCYYWVRHYECTYEKRS